eukprot:31386-Pelagococcus_subviridis.AAC.1
MAVVVHAERGDELQRASRGGEERQREVRPRHDRHLAVPLLQRHRHRARISRPRVDRSIPKFIFSTNERHAEVTPNDGRRRRRDVADPRERKRRFRARSRCRDARLEPDRAGSNRSRRVAK